MVAGKKVWYNKGVMDRQEEMVFSPRAERAGALHAQGFNCAQAVFCVFAEDFGLSAELAAKIACGLGAGVGGNREICGAVSAAALVLGLKYGPDKVAVYPRVKEFTDAFAARTHSLVCRELLGRKGEWPCRRLVQLAVSLLEERLA